MKLSVSIPSRNLYKSLKKKIKENTLHNVKVVVGETHIGSVQDKCSV